jgi:hypothetical protein
MHMRIDEAGEHRALANVEYRHICWQRPLRGRSNRGDTLILDHHEGILDHGISKVRFLRERSTTRPPGGRPRQPIQHYAAVPLLGIGMRADKFRCPDRVDVRRAHLDTSGFFL